jgi:uncharacterized membrane protein YeaQ/YmgE (transglycosylase-associated protein family)
MLWFLLFGLIVGVVARAIAPGRVPGGWIVSILLGIAGSFVAGWLGQFAGLYQAGEPAGWLMSILGAIVLVLIYSMVMGRRTYA